VLVLWAFLGLEGACIASDLVVDPRRNVPIATIGGVLLAASVYLAACTAITGILPASVLAKSTAPFADVTSVILGASIGAVVAACAALKASGTLGGWILLTSESARMAYIIDAPASSIGKGPTRRNFLITGSVMTVVIVVTSNPSIGAQFAMMANAVVIVMICVYATAGAALTRLSGGSGGKARRLPQALGGLSVLLSIAIASTQDLTTLASTAAVVVATICLHIFRDARRAPSSKRNEVEHD
jgi:arginine:agmatine antiporter